MCRSFNIHLSKVAIGIAFYTCDVVPSGDVIVSVADEVDVPVSPTNKSLSVEPWLSVVYMVD